MHVAELLCHLRIGEDIEIVEPSLPEMTLLIRSE